MRLCTAWHLVWKREEIDWLPHACDCANGFTCRSHARNYPDYYRLLPLLLLRRLLLLRLLPHAIRLPGWSAGLAEQAGLQAGLGLAGLGGAGAGAVLSWRLAVQGMAMQS